ncbi:hypothetical protein J5TS2_37390 [Brevibacillus halotolerans]|nr:hypothetical protein J5TS2_37390 [Brevibacillus halotolerans]
MLSIDAKADVVMLNVVRNANKLNGNLFIKRITLFLFYYNKYYKNNQFKMCFLPKNPLIFFP